ncbi:MAG: hypothetical protein FWG64_03495 [Firmicutes bacterium]|nr:hypothetical protein [Bacillota bacterium]
MEIIKRGNNRLVRCFGIDPNDSTKKIYSLYIKKTAKNAEFTQFFAINAKLTVVDAKLANFAQNGKNIRVILANKSMIFAVGMNTKPQPPVPVLWNDQTPKSTTTQPITWAELAKNDYKAEKAKIEAENLRKLEELQEIMQPFPNPSFTSVNKKFITWGYSKKWYYLKFRWSLNADFYEVTSDSNMQHALILRYKYEKSAHTLTAPWNATKKIEFIPTEKQSPLLWISKILQKAKKGQKQAVYQITGRNTASEFENVHGYQNKAIKINYAPPKEENSEFLPLSDDTTPKNPTRLPDGQVESYLVFTVDGEIKCVRYWLPNSSTSALYFDDFLHFGEIFQFSQSKGNLIVTHKVLIESNGDFDDLQNDINFYLTILQNSQNASRFEVEPFIINQNFWQDDLSEFDKTRQKLNEETAIWDYYFQMC